MTPDIPTPEAIVYQLPMFLRRRPSHRLARRGSGQCGAVSKAINQGARIAASAIDPRREGTLQNKLGTFPPKTRREFSGEGNGC
jgi:hypothetical protein